ncbi:MAG TPA: hypothetical protein VGN34_07830, partial [Ktedonobacteraceae bacterium]
AYTGGDLHINKNITFAISVSASVERSCVLSRSHNIACESFLAMLHYKADCVKDISTQNKPMVMVNLCDRAVIKQRAVDFLLAIAP